MMVKIMYVFDEVDSETGFPVARERFTATGMRGHDIGDRESMCFVITEGNKAPHFLQHVEEDGFIDNLRDGTPTGDIKNDIPNVGDLFEFEADLVWSECLEVYRLENVKWEVLS